MKRGVTLALGNIPHDQEFSSVKPPVHLGGNFQQSPRCSLQILSLGRGKITSDLFWFLKDFMPSSSVMAWGKVRYQVISSSVIVLPTPTFLTPGCRRSFDTFNHILVDGEDAVVTICQNVRGSINQGDVIWRRGLIVQVLGCTEAILGFCRGRRKVTQIVDPGENLNKISRGCSSCQPSMASSPLQDGETPITRDCKDLTWEEGVCDTDRELPWPPRRTRVPLKTPINSSQPEQQTEETT